MTSPLRVTLSFLLVLLCATRAPAGVDAVLPLKGKVAGVIDASHEVALLRTVALAGSHLTVAIKGKAGLVPAVEVHDLSAGTIVDIGPSLSGSGTSKVKLKKVPLVHTGLYEIRISGAAGSSGTFTLVSSIILPPSSKKIALTLEASALDETLVTFDALPSTVLAGSVTFIGAGTQPVPGVVLDGPLAAVDLSLKTKGSKHSIAKSPLSSVGTYRLSLSDPLAQGQVKVTLKLKNPKSKGAGKPAVALESATGHLELPAAAAALAGHLEVVTLVGSTPVAASGDFSVDTAPASIWQPIVFREVSCDQPVFLGLRDPATGAVEAGVGSTAKALLLFNPYLLYANNAQHQEYLELALASPEFTQLLATLEAAYAVDPCSALNLDAHPDVYTVLAQTMLAALKALPPATRAADGRLGDPPFIVDWPGPAVIVANPRHVFYAISRAGIDGVFVDVQKVERKEAIIVWEWPFEFSLDPAATNYVIGDGSFELWLTRGNLAKLLVMKDPEGLSATLNLAQGALYLIEMISGYLPAIPLDSLPLYVEIPAGAVVDFELAVMNQSPMDAVKGVIEFLDHNKNGIGQWILASAEEGASDAAAEFLSLASGVLKNVAFALKVLEAANEQGPFFWDWVFAPKEITYHVTQSGGVITSFDVNTAPVVSLEADPPAGIVGTQFQFDVSGTIDNADPVGLLDFQWDFEADGEWDTPWQASPLTSHVYDTPGAKTVIAAARDQGGLIGFATVIVNVGGGAGTASHVKLFRDALPWDSNATVTTLEALGFVEGTGLDSYEVLASSAMDNVPLIPGQDLVVISNDQPQGFYDNYAAAHLRFVQFVQNGGSLFWGACDNGWSEGSMSVAGVFLPGGAVPSYEFHYWNYVAAPDLPLMAGLPTAMDHNYASHERFLELPSGTTIYMVDDDGLPTLIEFSLGLGWVVMTGQPLEHQVEYVYGAPDMAALLPAILGYFTGGTPTLDAPVAAPAAGLGPPSGTPPR